MMLAPPAEESNYSAASTEKHQLDFQDSSAQSAETGIKMIDFKGLSPISVINPYKPLSSTSTAFNNDLQNVEGRTRLHLENVQMKATWSHLCKTSHSSGSPEMQLADVIFSSHSR